MTEKSVMPELDIFNLPVFADANIWSMWPADKLNELAEDIKDNGFDHRYPITIAEVEGVMMLLDGRNRREAAKIAGIIPPVIITDVEPKLAVHRSNYGTRTQNDGQKAMAFVMQWPNGLPRGRGKSSQIREQLTKTQENLNSMARFVYKNHPIAEGKDHPQICYDVTNGLLPLTVAHETTKRDVALREEEEAIRQANAEKLNDVRARYPNLAALVDDERLSLAQAIASAEQSDREAAENERRQREAEEAKLAEEERVKRETERQKKEYFEQCLTGFFHQLNQLISGTSVVVNEVQVAQLDQYQGYWDRFSQTYRHERKDVLRVLTALHKNLPTLIKKLETL